MNRHDTQTLLDKAKLASGSDYKTAQKIGATRFNLSDWRNGRRPIPVADVVLTAQLAGLDAVEWGSRAIAAQHEGTAKGMKLQAALKKAFVLTGAALVTSGASAAAITTTTAKVGLAYFIRCIRGKRVTVQDQRQPTA
jgi:hypothetical protein